jgi:N-carbamoylputrescine amidase
LEVFFMRATITQINASQLETDWLKLIEHIRVNESEFVLLPEMVFADWFCATPDVDETIWEDAVRSHEAWLARLSELGAKFVVGTAPRNIRNNKHNMAFSWTAEAGLQWIHSKTYLPDEDGFWEATWYDRAPVDFQPATIDGVRVGVMICTELWFMQHAREYGQQGVHLIVSPRCTPYATNDKWLVGGRTAGVIAGAYCLSSNPAGRSAHDQLGGAGWITDPEGNVLGLTSAEEPFCTVELDLAAADVAKAAYPRYVDDRGL